jgi:RNA-directed DNA polymerase
MHDPIEQTGKWLQSVIQGYFNYHAVPENMQRLKVFSEREEALATGTPTPGSNARPNWAWILRLVSRWSPEPKILHPYPDARFAASHPR